MNRSRSIVGRDGSDKSMKLIFCESGLYQGFDRFWMVETIAEILGVALLTWVHLCLVASVMNEERWFPEYHSYGLA